MERELTIKEQLRVLDDRNEAFIVARLAVGLCGGVVLPDETIRGVTKEGYDQAYEMVSETNRQAEEILSQP